MGQYQQWLHCWEVDQRLDTRLKRLQQELMQLQEKAHMLKITSALTNNVIIQALRHQHSSAAQHLTQRDQADYTSMVPEIQIDFSSTTEEEAITLLETMSQPAPFIATQLFVQSNLPNFAPEEIALSQPTAIKHVAMMLRAENNLLPEDIVAFIDGLAQVDQPQKYPWRQDNAIAPLLPNSGHNLVDQQSTRTNQSIQRWAKRWGRTSQTPYEQEESHTDER